jgi:hypothetical protein
MSRQRDGGQSDRNPREHKPNAAAEIARMQGDALSRTTSAMVKATGELQQSMARHTGQLQREAVHQLRMATNPVELMNVQTALLMAGWQHSIQCTSDLANAWFAIGTAGGLPANRKSLN